MTDAKKPEEKKPEPVLTIFQALPKITGEIAPISKTHKNVQQGYAFRGIDDVYGALNLLLAKYGVTILPEVLESKHEAAGTTKSGTTMWRHFLRVRYHLFAADGSCLKAESEGEGMDTGDKATPKAFSASFKTMAFQIFCIPTGEKVEPNVDSEDESPEVVQPKAAKPNGKPPQQSTGLAPEEAAFTMLTEALPESFPSVAERDAWKEGHRAQVKAMPTYLQKTFVEQFEKVPVLQ